MMHSQYVSGGIVKGALLLSEMFLMRSFARTLEGNTAKDTISLPKWWTMTML